MVAWRSAYWKGQKLWEVVKCAAKGPNHDRLLASDNPTWTDEPWPDDAVLVGEVRWMARTLP